MRFIACSLTLLTIFSSFGCYVEERRPRERVVYEERPADEVVVEEHETVVVQEEPPVVREEVIVGVAPSAAHVWVRGYWRWNGRQWIWIGGRWVRCPHGPGYRWRPGVWVRGAGGHFHLTAGVWIRG